MTEIKPWRDRVPKDTTSFDYPRVCRETADAEIAELRAALARLKAQQGDLVAREQDLSMMCRRLILALRRTAEDDSADLTLANKSLAWLQSKGLAGSPLRDVHPVRPMSEEQIDAAFEKVASLHSIPVSGGSVVLSAIVGVDQAKEFARAIEAHIKGATE